jgi:cytochrome b6-f complex iron-sulfur subunit
MRLLDDLSLPSGHRACPRRRFLKVLTGACLGAVAAGGGVIGWRYLWPPVLFELPSRFRAARLSELESSRILFKRKQAIYLVRDGEGVFAQSAVCTHLGCLTRPTPTGDGFFCPCHGSRFALDGSVLAGPAPRPLPHFRVELKEDYFWVDSVQEEDPDARLRV